uniref:Probable sodium channel toxin Ts27 n=1 Tax=Tityus serrulatus TaxID=6887 RepID=SCX27_TITSE|nr:RecName: Full=Putative sodium channel toxin Ts27; AltName: Full=Putative NaTx; AltName: Full=Tityustoxin-27; Flags: Precursor [Tityus serrulatus]QPD99023.1 putative sodium channel toxin Ts27 [Tityus serrulatus]
MYNMVSLFIVAVLLLTYANVEGSDVTGGFPVNSNNCIYPCYSTQDEIQCEEFCEKLNGRLGYCRRDACYCEHLPESVKQITNSKTFDCSNGPWDLSTV